MVTAGQLKQYFDEVQTEIKKVVFPTKVGDDGGDGHRYLDIDLPGPGGQDPFEACCDGPGLIWENWKCQKTGMSFIPIPALRTR